MCCVLAAVGLSLSFAFDHDASRSASVQNCLERHGLPLHHGTQNLAVIPPSEVVAVLNATAGDRRLEVMFFKGTTERHDALTDVRIDVGDWKASHNVGSRPVVTVVNDAVVGWSAPPTHTERRVFSTCLT